MKLINLKLEQKLDQMMQEPISSVNTTYIYQLVNQSGFY